MLCHGKNAWDTNVAGVDIHRKQQLATLYIQRQVHYKESDSHRSTHPRTQEITFPVRAESARRPCKSQAPTVLCVHTCMRVLFSAHHWTTTPIIFFKGRLFTSNTPTPSSPWKMNSSVANPLKKC